MLAILYSLGSKTVEILTQLAALFNPKAKQIIAGRKSAFASISNQLKNNSKRILWIHCSSVGEYEQGRPVMEAFKMHYPDYKTLITFYSPSGYNAVETDDIVDFKIYLPRDSAANARKLIDIIQPKLAMFIKYEFWHYYLRELNQKEIPVFSVSAIFRPEQIYFRWYGGFNRKILDNISHFFVQDKPSQQLLATINISCTVTGDTRLDRVMKIKEQKKPLPEIDAFAADKKLMVVGSMRKEDVEIVIEFVNQHKDLKFIIAPHEIEESMIQPLEKRLSSTIRYSKLKSESDSQQVLIIDNIGMLSQLYRYASYAYIGGGFSDGLHNILEAAVYRIPLFFGNREYQRFKEAIDLIDLGVAFPIGSVQELTTVFNDLSGNLERMAELRESLADYISENQGASEKIITALEPYLS